MSANEVHEGDIGTIFEVTVMDDTDVVDISLASTKEIIFKKSNSTTVTKPAAFVTDGSDGKMKYTSVEDDLSPTGDWDIQAYVDLPAGEWHSDIGHFTVHKNL